jgi:hypothetical protein
MRYRYENSKPAKINQSRNVIHYLKKLCLWSFAAILAISFLGAGQSASKHEPIVLQAEQLPFSPKEFYIANVIDERTDRTAVAWLLPASTNAVQPSATYPVDLQGGGIHAIREFIQKSLPGNKALRPIIIRIKEYRVTESIGAQGRVNGHVAVAMSFDYKRDGIDVHLTDYSGNIRYSRPARKILPVEPALRQSLVGALKYLNNWIDQEAGHNEKLAKGINVFFKEYTQGTENDTVFYSSQRQLTWDDFQSKPYKPTHYAASIFSSFAYDGNSEVVDGYLHIYLTLKTFAVKNASWVKGNARDEYGLNHEQRHFDIVKMVAERFKKKIQPDILSVEDFNSIIQYQYIESFREMNRLQEEYDNETQHGLNRAAQERWNQRIDEELKTLTVKK